jgi:peptide/nickel transport system substrate-binding protein
MLVGTVAAVFSLVLSSCSSNSTNASSTTSYGSNNGTLSVGIMGTDDESIDPHATTTAYASDLRDDELYESLTTRDPQGNVSWALATAMTPNSDLTQWTVKLRPNVKTHNGGVFTADDVIFSVKRILNAKQQAAGAPLISDVIDPNKVVKIDDTTVQFTLKKPYGPFKELWTDGYLYMVPSDWTAQKPDGTGPFSYVSATPGQQSTFVRFDGYWGGAAKFKTLKIVDFSDMEAIVNALRGGQVDVAAQVPLTEADALNSGDLKVLTSKSPFTIIIGFRTDIAPFNDPRVMQAVRLLVDRNQVVTNAFDGHGAVANDIFSRAGGSCALPDVPQRTPDIAKAKQLLAEAGQSNLTFSIANPGDTPGMSEMLQVLQANAKQAGVTVKIDTMSFAKYGDGWLKWPVSVDVGAHPYLFDVKNSLMAGANANIAHWNDPEFMTLANQLLQTVDPAKQCSLEQQMQKIEYDRSGYLLTAWSDTLTAYRPGKVAGLVPALYNLSTTYLQNVSVKG